MAHALHNIPELDRKGLREFGLMTGGTVAGLFGLLFPWLLDHAWPLWPWVVFGVLALWALAIPRTLRPVYRVWMRFGLLLSRITTPVILALVYFVIVTPMAAVLRLRRNDPMARRFNQTTESYRIPSRKVPVKNLEKPF